MAGTAIESEKPWLEWATVGPASSQNCMDTTSRYLAARRYVGAIGLLLAAVLLILTKLQLEDRDFKLPPVQLLETGSSHKPDDFHGYSSDGGGDSFSMTARTDNCILDRKFMPNGSMPLTLLLSFPGSGNTWARYLIERISGIYSSSCYNDNGDGDDGGPAVFVKSNPCARRTIVTKSHGWEIDERNNLRLPGGRGRCHFDGAIFLVRNPYGAILAEFNRQRGGKTGYANESEFTGGGWEHFVETRAEKWTTLAEKALTGISDRLVVYYEDLVGDTAREIHRMMTYLQVPCDERRLRCLLDNATDGDYKRKHRTFITNPYSASMNRTVDRYIRITRELLQRHREPPLPPYESTV